MELFHNFPSFFTASMMPSKKPNTMIITHITICDYTFNLDMNFEKYHYYAILNGHWKQAKSLVLVILRL